MEKKISTLASISSKKIKADLDLVSTSDGGSKERIVIRHPNAICVIPFAAPGKILMVTQHRYAIDLESLEIPAGKMEPGEDPQTTAIRELAEETGYQAGSWKKLASFAPASGYSTEIIHLFLAKDLSPLPDPQDCPEITKVESIDISEVKKMIISGKIIDGPTIASLGIYDWSED